MMRTRAELVDGNSEGHGLVLPFVISATIPEYLSSKSKRSGSCVTQFVCQDGAMVPYDGDEKRISRELSPLTIGCNRVNCGEVEIRG